MSDISLPLAKKISNNKLWRLTHARTYGVALAPHRRYRTLAQLEGRPLIAHWTAKLFGVPGLCNKYRSPPHGKCSLTLNIDGIVRTDQVLDVMGGKSVYRDAIARQLKHSTPPAPTLAFQ